MTVSGTPLARLVRRLDLDEVGVDRFRTPELTGEGWVFGGLLAALAVMAGGRTAVGRQLHSMHLYFLRPGRFGVPLEIDVTRLRDGRALTARRMTLRQGRDAILEALASFTAAQSGLEHQAPMPVVAPPDDLRDWEDVRAEAYGIPRRPDGPLEIRDCDPDAARPARGRAAVRRVWMRPHGRLPDNPLVHAAVLVFATDRNFLSTAARPHGLGWDRRLGASVDHAVWLHHPPRFDDWLLSASDSPISERGRALVQGAMYTRAGVRIATVTQEGLIRGPRSTRDAT